MNLDEAEEWLKGEMSTWNDHHNPHDPDWRTRYAAEDAALVERAYWMVRAHKEGLVGSMEDTE